MEILIVLWSLIVGNWYLTYSYTKRNNCKPHTWYYVLDFGLLVLGTIYTLNIL